MSSKLDKTKIVRYNNVKYHLPRSRAIKTKLVELREKFNLTQAELASRVGVSRQTIISIENGKYNPSIFLAYQLAKQFSKTIEEIFLFEEN